LSAADITIANKSITECVAQFVHATRFDDIPARVVQLGKKAILDCLGLALAGAQAEGSAILRRHIGEMGCTNGATTIFGTNLRAPSRFAALANGTAMHSDDYDDSYHPSRIHPSAVVVAALFADAETGDRSGRDILTAYHVGVEVSCRISQAIDAQHYQRGYHATGTCGVFGAAASVCNLQRLPVETIRTAFGIAGSEAAGLRENFGTMVKPLHTGRAAENGLVAASLAKMGYTAAPTVLEGARGFFMAAGGGYDAQMIQDKLGNPWSFATPGISIKPFPSGALTHPAMSKLQEMVVEHDIRPEQVGRIGIRTNRLLPENLTYHRPTTGLQGKFSMEFCLASILLLRRAGLAEFTDEVVNRPDIQEAISRIDYTAYSDKEAAENDYKPLTSFLDVVLKDGRRISARADVAKGHPSIPMTEDDVVNKFRECAAFASWPEDRSEKIIKAILELEKLARMADLTALLRRAS
jgi:2-methylcitrate dehydratase PrpD